MSRVLLGGPIVYIYPNFTKLKCQLQELKDQFKDLKDQFQGFEIDIQIIKLDSFKT